MNGQSFPESDWKKFRKLHVIALDRFCKRVLAEIVSAAADPEKSAHERYLAVYDLINQRNKKMAVMFDDVRRSTAWDQLAHVLHENLVSELEIAQFGPETQDAMQRYKMLWET